MITIEEAKKMIGTEFIYYFEDGDSIPAYVKKFDTDIGLTCISLTTRTKNRKTFPKNHPSRQEDSTFCVISTNLKEVTDQTTKEKILTKTLATLTEIKLTGNYYTKNNYCSDNPVCAF